MYHFFTFNINLKKITNFLSQIKKQSIIILFFEFIIEIFKINQACSLAIFIPQKCYNRDNSCNIDYISEPHMCTIKENVTCLSIYNKFVLYFNFFSIFCFFILYIIEIRRELWLLDHFNYNEDIISNISSDYKNKNNILFNKLTYCNKIYFNSYIILSFVYITNFIFSGLLILLFDFYLNLNSITVYITSFLLCSNKMISGIYVAYLSYYENKPISYYTKYNLSYNEVKIEHTSNFTNRLYNLFSSISYNDLSNFLKKNNISSDIINDDIQIEIQKTNSSKKSNNCSIYPENIRSLTNNSPNSSTNQDVIQTEDISNLTNSQDIRRTSLTNNSSDLETSLTNNSTDLRRTSFTNKFNNLVIEINE